MDVVVWCEAYDVRVVCDVCVVCEMCVYVMWMCVWGMNWLIEFVAMQVYTR